MCAHVSCADPCLVYVYLLSVYVFSGGSLKRIQFFRFTYVFAEKYMRWWSASLLRVGAPKTSNPGFGPGIHV